MNFNNITDRYLENNVMTASPEQLTLMLYNGCIKNINLAHLSIEAKDVELSNRHIGKAQDIIFELKATLNFKFEISKQFSTMYDFIIENLIDANIKKDAEHLDIALRFVTEFRDVWYEAMKIKGASSKPSKVV